MKVGELRIGNLVLSGDEICKVTGIHDSGIIQAESTNNRSGEGDDYELIALTEEWLERFGFEKNHNSIGTKDEPIYSWSRNFKHTNFLVFEYPSDFRFDFKQGHYHTALPRFVRLYEVHQLQNLFFALTGEELELES